MQLELLPFRISHNSELKTHPSLALKPKRPVVVQSAASAVQLDKWPDEPVEQVKCPYVWKRSYDERWDQIE
jgi:hypothetical protein